MGECFHIISVSHGCCTWRLRSEGKIWPINTKILCVHRTKWHPPSGEKSLCRKKLMDVLFFLTWVQSCIGSLKFHPCNIRHVPEGFFTCTDLWLGLISVWYWVMSIKHERINSSFIPRGPYCTYVPPSSQPICLPLCSRSQCVAYSILNALIVVWINITHSTDYYTHSSMAK